jgi:hypothetical protein
MMATHKFKVDQTLMFSPRRIGYPQGDQSCKVVRLMPIEGGEFQYRIKCNYDNVERIVKESQLWFRS